jgi:hypothetical protein
MKKRIIIAIGLFFICYLLGSFFSLSFFISDWKEETREFVAIFGGFISFVAASFPRMGENDNW